MPKAAQPAPKQLSRRQLSRRDREQRQSRMIVIGAAVVLAAVVLIIGYGLLDQYVLKPRTPMATVAGEPIRVSTYQKLVQYRRSDYRGYLANLQDQRLQYAAMDDDTSYVLEIIDQQISYVESLLQNVPYSVIDELIDDEITRQECELRGLYVSEEEVQLEFEQTFGYDRNPPTPTPITATVSITETPTPTVAPMTYDEFTSNTAKTFEAMKKATGFTEADFRGLIESSLYRKRLEASIGATVPITAEHVHVQQILVASQEEADAVVARLDAGEAWDALASELSTDSATAASGGDLGWFTRGNKGDTFDGVVFAAEPDPLKTLIIADDYGFHAVRVLDRDPARFLSESDLEAAKQQAVTDWFAERSTKEDVVNLWESWMVPPDTTAIS